jgi:hypothetical protein
VLASILVERAKVLARFVKPAEAFKDRWSVQYPNQANLAELDDVDARMRFDVLRWNHTAAASGAIVTKEYT